MCHQGEQTAVTLAQLRKLQGSLVQHEVVFSVDQKLLHAGKQMLEAETELFDDFPRQTDGGILDVGGVASKQFAENFWVDQGRIWLEKRLNPFVFPLLQFGMNRKPVLSE